MALAIPGAISNAANSFIVENIAKPYIKKGFKRLRDRYYELTSSAKKPRLSEPDPKTGMASTGIQEAPGTQNSSVTTARFVDQQGAYFLNDTEEAQHYQEFIFLKSGLFGETTFAKVTREVHSFLIFKPVQEILAAIPTATSFFSFFNQAKFLGVEGYCVHIHQTAPEGGGNKSKVSVTMAPYNMPLPAGFERAVPDSSFLPHATEKTMTYPSEVGGSKTNEMLRFALENPLFLITEGAGDTKSAVPTNQYFYTIGGGSEYINPEYYGLIMKEEVVGDTFSNLCKFRMDFVLKMKFHFKGLRGSNFVGGSPTSAQPSVYKITKPRPYQIR